MFRTLTAKAVVPVALAITGFVVICCLALYTTVKADLTKGAYEQEKSLAATVIKSAHYTMLNADREGLDNIVRNIGEGRGVQHLRILNTRGEIAFSSRPQEVGQKKAPRGKTASARDAADSDGAEVLAIAVPIFNEPACFNAACHVHSASQKELGTLDIGISTLPLQRSLNLMRGRMLVFCCMVLLLTIGGVAALLQRNVFTPIELLTEYSDRAAAGPTEAHCPSTGGEIGRLATNIATLSGQRDQAQAELAQLRHAPTPSAAPQHDTGAHAGR